MTNLIKQLTELKQLPPMTDAEERERETYEEDNVRQLILDGAHNTKIIRKTGVSLKFIAQIKKELRKEGFFV